MQAEQNTEHNIQPEQNAEHNIHSEQNAERRTILLVLWRPRSPNKQKLIVEPG